MKGFIQRIVGDEVSYWNLVHAIKDNAELPICLQHRDPINAKISMEDMQDFATKFYKDAGIMPSFEINFCQDCGKLHFFIVIEEPENT